MIEVSILKDASEVVRYNLPDIPLYISTDLLSGYMDMRALCHWHEDMEYIRVLEGDMYYDVNGENILIHKGDALLVNAKQMHYGFSFDQSDCLFTCILFKAPLLAATVKMSEKYIDPVTSHSSLPYVSLHASQAEEKLIITLFDDIYEFDLQKETGYELMILSRLAAAWSRLFRLLSPGLQSLDTLIDDNLIVQRKMIDFIHNNYAAGLSLADIAAAGTVCRSKCCRIFRKYLNRTPIEFLNAYRLEVSMRLLADTRLCITEIAFACGFQSPSYYAELFHKYKGCSPSSYRLIQSSAN